MRGWDHTDRDACYRAVSGRDRRFDGVFFVAVRTTGIYCRPSCPARTPARRNVEFHPTAASAQSAGFRACKRCLPDAMPGSPEWDVAGDVAGRAMRLVADGVVDREGVPGLAARLGYTPRHLSRLVSDRLGASPLALARARRAQTARVLITSGDLGFADIAFASGFSSVRQFNETIREVFGMSPSQMRGRREPAGDGPRGEVRMRLAVRTPYAGRALLDFLATRAVAGVEHAGDGAYSRTLALPHGPGVVRVELDDLPELGSTGFLPATYWLTDLRDLGAAVERTRRLLDADADPMAIRAALSADPVLGALAAATPGLRVPGHVDGHEVAVRAVLGQQVSVAAARTTAARLASRLGMPLEAPHGELRTLFPSASAIAEAGPEGLPMPRARAQALVDLCGELAAGRIALDRGADRADVRRRLLAVRGIGPWTADYIALRALGDPDVFLGADLGTRQALAGLGADPDPESWRPWRSYAQVHLWHHLAARSEDHRERRATHELEGSGVCGQ